MLNKAEQIAAFKRFGTICHNRRASLAEIRETCGFTNDETRGLVRSGHLERVADNEYFPTRKGWEIIEGDTD